MTCWITASEVRLALRLIAKQPVLSITIVVALATGVGLATVGFTLRDAVLHGSLPFANGDRFVRLVLHSEAEDNVELDLEAYHAIRDTSKSFAHLGAAGGAAFALESPDGTVETISVGLLTPRSFQFLPAVPISGRLFRDADSDARRGHRNTVNRDRRAGRGQHRRRMASGGARAVDPSGTSTEQRLNRAAREAMPSRRSRTRR